MPAGRSRGAFSFSRSGTKKKEFSGIMARNVMIRGENPERRLERLVEIRDRMERLVEGFQGRVAGNVRTVLGIDLERPRVFLDVSVPPMPDTSCGRVFDSHFDIVWFLIPTALFGPLIRRHFLHHVGFETEKNLFRLSVAWRESTAAEIARLAGQAGKAIRSELSTLEALLGRQADESPGIREGIAELTGYLEVSS
jgi:hypothetical protein